MPRRSSRRRWARSVVGGEVWPRTGPAASRDAHKAMAQAAMKKVRRTTITPGNGPR